MARCVALVCLWGLWIGLAPLGEAQTTPVDTSGSVRGDVRTGVQVLEDLDSDDAGAVPDLAHELVRSLGRAWETERPTLPIPDSSRFDHNLGDVWWSAPGFPVDGFRALIQNGRFESVTLDFSEDGPDLSAFARRLYNRLGSPRADGFYSTDQTGYPFSLAIDSQANRLTARAVPGQLVGEHP